MSADWPTCPGCNLLFMPWDTREPDDRSRCSNCQPQLPTTSQVVTAFSLMMEEPTLDPSAALAAVTLDSVTLPSGALLQGGVAELLRLALLGHTAEQL